MNLHAVHAIYRFEMARTGRTIWQSIVSPVLSTSLYFVVFGAAIGTRITQIEGVSYGAFIVPGLMLAVAWMVAVPAQVVEHTGVFGAIGRSAELTRGHRWAIFGLLVIYIIASLVLQGSILGIVGVLAVSLSPNMSQAATQMVAQPLLNVATSLIGAAGVASIYYELRSSREGIGPEALAAVFD